MSNWVATVKVVVNTEKHFKAREIVQHFLDYGAESNRIVAWEFMGGGVRRARDGEEVSGLKIDEEI